MKQELVNLRAAMRRAGVDIYIVPTDDFHGSEYVGEYFQSRRYLSGFTGSAGTLIVEKVESSSEACCFAGLWTDGRYFIQAERELTGSGITLFKSGQPGVPSVEEWLKQYLSDASRPVCIGFDGRTMSATFGRRLEKLTARFNASIQESLDLVDEIWEDRPPLSTAPAWELDVRYAGRTRADKLAALRQDLKDASADCLILTSLDDIAWLLNIRGDDIACCPVVLAYMVVTAETIILYSDERKYPEVLKKRLALDGITLCPYEAFYEEIAKPEVPCRVMLDPEKINYRVLQALPKSARVLFHKNPTQLSKAVKTPEECGNMRLAHIKDGVALTRFMKWLKEHVATETITECSAADKLESFRREQEHYLGPSFEPIMGYGANGAIIHYSATEETNTVLKPEGFLLSDTGGHYLEGTTDVTRTFVLGELTEEMKHHYTLVLRGNLALAAAHFHKGCSGLSLDYLARKPLWDEGLDYNHGTGHGVGYLLSVHEGPQAIRYHVSPGRSEHAPMLPGMITSDEPGLYLEGRYGIRLENLLLCVEKEQTDHGTFLGFDTLTMCPFCLEAVNVSELSAYERTLLNTYHKTVFDTLSPYLDEEEVGWLRHATREI